MSADEVQRRTILHKDWVPCKAAFVDCKTPGSDQKDNYSFIGLGVAQNGSQFINLQEPHGFSLGAAGMPKGVTNSLHLHFTAEVFINFGGDYQLRWGADGGDGEYISTDGDVISVPPWIFRGFTNIGSDDGILLTVLGRDENGGIIWGPSVLKEAATHGLYLKADNTLIDTEAGDELPPDDQLIKPMPQSEIDRLQHFTADDFSTRVVRPNDRTWIERPFLTSTLPGGGAQLCLVIGFGMAQTRHDAPRLADPHSFNLAWLRAMVGEGMLTHRHSHTQVVTVRSGRWRLTVNTGADERSVELGPRDSFSVPPNVWRSMTLVEGPTGGASTHGELLVVNSGDDRVVLEWDPRLVAAARDAGVVIDPDGYTAPASVLVSATADD